ENEDQAFWFGSQAMLSVGVQMITGEWENGRRRLLLLADLITHMNRIVQEPLLERLDTTSAYIDIFELAARERSTDTGLHWPKDPLRVPCYSVLRRLIAFALAHPNWPKDVPPPPN